jgi:hypothetical protein
MPAVGNATFGINNTIASGADPVAVANQMRWRFIAGESVRSALDESQAMGVHAAASRGQSSRNALRGREQSFLVKSSNPHCKVLM